MLPIVHHPLYDASSVPDDHRFPMRKYTLVAELVRQSGLAQKGFYEPILAPEDWLSLAHDEAYVDAVLYGKLSKQQQRRIGFEWSPHVANRARASASGTLLAGRLALEYGAAVNLAGGSHHAHRDGGAGFCVFNDVAVATSVLLSEGACQRILVVDCDVHHGDGTARIFAADPRVFTFSLHCEDNWPLEKPESDLDVALPKKADDAAYLVALADSLKAISKAFLPDLVYYNAGVDPHVHDRLGKLDLTDEGLSRRDQLVADWCKEHAFPVTGVLGGGYSMDALAVAQRHMFMVEAINSLLS